MSVPIRDAIIAGNWKMNYGPKEAAAFTAEIISELGTLLSQYPYVYSILCPPAISLMAVQEVLDAHLFRRLELGAQNMYFEEKGAFTGEISPAMVSELCSSVILGHSERRTYFGETDEIVNKKTLAAFRHGLRPIVCIGERLDQYEAGQTAEVIHTRFTRAWQIFPLRMRPTWLSPMSQSGQLAPDEPQPLRARVRWSIRSANFTANSTAQRPAKRCVSSTAVA
jgi:triosephosphate isomerase